MHIQCKIRKANFYCLITNVCYCKCMKVIWGTHVPVSSSFKKKKSKFFEIFIVKFIFNCRIKNNLFMKNS